MSIKFGKDDWDRIKETYDNWWNRTLERPAIKLTLQHEVPCTSSIPLLSQANCHRLDICPEEIPDYITSQIGEA